MAICLAITVGGFLAETHAERQARRQFYLVLSIECEFLLAVVIGLWIGVGLELRWRILQEREQGWVCHHTGSCHIRALGILLNLLEPGTEGHLISEPGSSRFSRIPR